MKVDVKYFGMIAEKVGCSGEEFEFELGDKLNLRTIFEKKYNVLSDMSFKIVVNQEFIEEIEIGNKEIEIALLPPFAGG